MSSNDEPVRPGGGGKLQGARRFERDEVIMGGASGLHQGQHPCGATRTGRTRECTRPVLTVAQKLLRHRGRPQLDVGRAQVVVTPVGTMFIFKAMIVAMPGWWPDRRLGRCSPQSRQLR